MIDFYGKEIIASEKEREDTLKFYFLSTSPLVLKEMPAKLKKKLVVLPVVAKQFSENKEYSEKEVNEILKNIYSKDHVYLRRSLIECDFLQRTEDCSRYYMSNKI